MWYRPLKLAFMASVHTRARICGAPASERVRGGKWGGERKGDRNDPYSFWTCPEVVCLRSGDKPHTKNKTLCYTTLLSQASHRHRHSVWCIKKSLSSYSVSRWEVWRSFVVDCGSEFLLVRHFRQGFHSWRPRQPRMKSYLVLQGGLSVGCTRGFL